MQRHASSVSYTNTWDNRLRGRGRIGLTAHLHDLGALHAAHPGELAEPGMHRVAIWNAFGA